MAPYRSLFDLRGCSGPALKYALELGMDPNRTLSKGQTNLFGAAKRGDVEKVKVGRIWFHSACFWNNKQLGGGPWIHCRHQRIVFDCWLNIKHLILIDSDFGRGWVYVTNKVSLPSFQKWFAVALPRFGLASLVIGLIWDPQSRSQPSRRIWTNMRLSCSWQGQLELVDNRSEICGREWVYVEPVRMCISWHSVWCAAGYTVWIFDYFKFSPVSSMTLVDPENSLWPPSLKYSIMQSWSGWRASTEIEAFFMPQRMEDSRWQICY